MAEFLKAHGTPIQGSPGSFNLDVHSIGAFRRLDRRLRNHEVSLTLLPHAFIIALVAQYDAFLGDLLRVMFAEKPELLNASGKQITFSQLSFFKTLEEARGHIMEKEVEGVLRDSHADQFQWLESRLGIPLRKGLEIWPTFIEITERRNLFTHCGGVVSTQYLQVCSEHQVPLESGLRRGDNLDSDAKYCRRAYRCIFELGVKLGQVVWRKISPDDAKSADTTLNDICIELISMDEYELAIALLHFACTTLERFISCAEYRGFFQLNLAQAYKWSGQTEKCEKILDSVDWSDKSDKMRLGASVLRGTFKEAAGLVRRIGPGDESLAYGYMNWPIFKEFRKSAEFLEAYEGAFKKPFAIVEEPPQLDTARRRMAPDSDN